jgi:hypothetical protein
VGFVVKKVALGQVFLRVFRFFPVKIIPPSFSILRYHPGDEQYVRQWQQFRDVVSPHRNLQSTEACTASIINAMTGIHGAISHTAAIFILAAVRT